MNALGILAVYQFTVKAIIESNSTTHTHILVGKHPHPPIHSQTRYSEQALNEGLTRSGLGCSSVVECSTSLHGGPGCENRKITKSVAR